MALDERMDPDGPGLHGVAPSGDRVAEGRGGPSEHGSAAAGPVDALTSPAHDGVPGRTHAAEAAAWQGLLILELSESGRALRARLVDGRWFAVSACGSWPVSPGTAALPPAIAAALAQRPQSTLDIQLCAALDAWPWEREVHAAGAGQRGVARYVVDLPPQAPPASPVPLPLLLAAPPEPAAVLALVHAAREQGRPLVLWGTGLPTAHRQALEQRLRHLRRTPLALREALVLALAQMGLDAASCRLYGDDAARPPEPAPGRRPVTALSIDVVGSTPLLAAIGAEAYARRLHAYHARLRNTIVSLQGSLDVPQGDDGLMAYFGFPLAVEEAANRALDAAWRIARGMGELALEVRVGVASGPVVVSGQQAFGRDVHLAARLRAQAPPGQVYVAGSTVERADDSFRLGRIDGGLALEGLGRVEAVYRLEDAPEVAIGRRRRVGTSARLVGRRRELAQLHAAWAEARTGRCGWCVVRGEAGIGKSRLLQAFVEQMRADGGRCIEFVAQAQATRSPYAALLDGLRRQSEDAAADPLPADPRRWGDTLLGALRAHVGAGPLCLVVDDAHWLDPSSLDLLRRLAEPAAPQPLLVLLGERSDSGAAPLPAGATAVDLAGLDAQAATELVEQIDAELSEAARRRVIERAGGVPLYLEECARMPATGAGADADAVPATLEDLLMVRLEALGPELPLAQVLSVLGREFDEPQMQALLAEDDAFVAHALGHGSLEALLDSGLLQVAESAPRRYRFKHALIAAAAYRTLHGEVQARLHALCAALIGRLGEAWPQHREQLAQHLEAAGRLESALRAWADAARAAAARHAHAEAAALARKALALLPRLSPAAAAAHAHDELQLQLLLASASIALHGYGSAAVESAYLAADAAGRRLPDAGASLRIRLGLEACYVMRGDLDRAEALAREAVAATDWATEPRLALQARWALANVHFHRGDAVASLAGFDECLGRYRPALHRARSVQDTAVMCLGYGSWNLFELGRADEALQRIERLLLLAGSLAHPFSLGVALGFAASLKRLCGDPDGAWPHAQQALRVCEDGGFQVWLGHAWMVQGQLRADRGDIAAGDADMERGYALWVGSGARISCATYLVTRAGILLRQRRVAVAQRLLDEAEAVSQAIGEHYHRAELLRLQGLAAWRDGAAARAEALLQQALEEAQAQRKPGRGLRVGLTLGALEAAHGRGAAAAARLAALLGALPRHGRSRDTQRAHQVLPGWAAGASFDPDADDAWEPT